MASRTMNRLAPTLKQSIYVAYPRCFSKVSENFAEVPVTTDTESHSLFFNLSGNFEEVGLKVQNELWPGVDILD